MITLKLEIGKKIISEKKCTELVGYTLLSIVKYLFYWLS